MKELEKPFDVSHCHEVGTERKQTKIEDRSVPVVVGFC